MAELLEPFFDKIEIDEFPKEYVEKEKEYKKNYQNTFRGGRNKKKTFHICIKNF